MYTYIHIYIYMQNTATHSNTQQHTATHRNTLQHKQSETGTTPSITNPRILLETNPLTLKTLSPNTHCLPLHWRGPTSTVEYPSPPPP